MPPPLHQQLLAIEPRQIPFFSFQGVCVPARVVNVVEGDKCTLMIPGVFGNPMGMSRISVRLQGVDCPHVRAPQEDERQRAFAARDFLWDVTGHGRQIVMVEFGRNDPYGYPLVTLYNSLGQAPSYNHQLIRLGYGRPHQQQGGGGGPAARRGRQNDRKRADETRRESRTREQKDARAGGPAASACSPARSAATRPTDEAV